MNHAKSFLKTSVLCFVLLTFLSGCAKDYSMNPPPDGEKVEIVIKMPKELEPQPLRVMYRSSVCRKVVHDGDGRPESLEGYKAYDSALTKRGVTEFYEAKLYVNGGGRCNWRISNIMFGIKYRLPSRFGESVTQGTGGTVIVKFDGNRAQLSVGGTRKVVGPDLTIVKDYYPWVSEKFIDGYARRANLSSENRGYLNYEAREARSIYFEPVLHSNVVVTSVSPKKHVIGDFIKFYYPDGSVESDWRARPNFEKMQKIRLAAEAKK
ncbi:hypothetical protein ACQKEN_13790 [Pseudomonas sp. NPDC078416]|uniref:hypothetical protein n=1 Tax=Pseudomonas sp. NPDC078416 TaxID=3390637 RepID=UPI003CFCF71F